MSVKARYLIVVGVVIIIGASGFAYYYVSNQISRPLSNSATSSIVVSDFNSSLPCGEIVSPPSYLKASLNTLVSQLMNSSKFKTLSQGRPFQYADSPGPGCGFSYVPPQPVTPYFDFVYIDMTHPYTRCGETAYPSYQMTAAVYLVPQGYDLSRTQWSITYFGPDNVSSTCTSTTST